MPTDKTEPSLFPTSDSMSGGRDAAGQGAIVPSNATTLHKKPTEEKVDGGVEESFPASDPVSVSVTKVLTPSDPENEAPTASPKRQA